MNIKNPFADLSVDTDEELERNNKTTVVANSILPQSIGDKKRKRKIRPEEKQKIEEEKLKKAQEVKQEEKEKEQIIKPKVHEERQYAGKSKNFDERQATNPRVYEERQYVNKHKVYEERQYVNKPKVYEERQQYRKAKAYGERQYATKPTFQTLNQDGIEIIVQKADDYINLNGITYLIQNIRTMMRNITMT
jgi:hypothetical protein